jgi:tyrosine-specific transport protein
MPTFIASILFTLGLGLIVYNGIKLVDYINRGLMFIKLGTLLLLLILISPHVSLKLLSGGELKYITSAIMILITSFGFASIVPSLRSYFADDIMQLRRAILIGSLIPLFSYIAWDAVLMGVIPTASFKSIIASGHTTTSLTANLNQTIHNIWITDFFRTFAAICMLTAFLGVSLGLFDFLADGLKLKKHGKQGRFVFIATFLPPLALVLFFPDLYLNALQFAGILCVLLLLLLPVLMAYRGRYLLNLKGAYQVTGGKPLLITLGLTAIILLIIATTSLK